MQKSNESKLQFSVLMVIRVALIMAQVAVVFFIFIVLNALIGYGDAKAEPLRVQMEVHASKTEAKYDLPQGLLRAICEQESGWRNVVGQHGEIGVCQIKPDTVLLICRCKDNAGSFVIQRGLTGDTVRRVQSTLILWGFLSVRVDGVFSADTERAVRAFQAGVGIKPDGVVGPVTWAVLFQGEPYPGNTVVSSLWNPYKNIEWAAAYLSWLSDALETRDVGILSAAYNGGPGNASVKYMLGVKRRMASKKLT